MTKTSLLLTLLALACAGCHREVAPGKEVKSLAPLEESTIPAAPPPPPDSAAESGVYPDAAPQLQFARVAETEPLRGPVIDLPDDASPAFVLPILSRAVKQFAGLEKRAPKTLEELVNAGLISSVPPPPQGGKFVIDAGKSEVRIE